MPLVGSVDVMLMGHLGSQAHLGAIGLAGSVFNFIYWNFAFLRMSMAGFTAQAFGAKNTNEASVLLGRSFLLAMAGAFLVLVLQIPIEKLAFYLAKADADVEEYARIYFRIRIYAAPATIGMYSIIGWLIGMQNARATMVIALAINLVNILFSAFFVVVLKMDSEGVAWGTLIAQYTGLLIAMIILLRKYKSYIVRIRVNELFVGGSILKFFSVNTDIFVRTFFIMLVLTYFNFASAEQGKVVLGINVIYLQLIYVFSFFIDGFANASEAIVGRFIGENNKSAFQKSVRTIFIWGISLATIFSTVYLIAHKPLVKLYTSDVEIIRNATDYAVWIIILPLVSIAAFIWDGIYLGATASREQRNATLLAAVIFITLYLSLRSRLGNHALLIAQLAFFATRGVVQTIFYKSAILQRYFK